MLPAIAATPLSLHCSRSFLTGIEDKPATNGYKHECEVMHVISVSKTGLKPQVLLGTCGRDSWVGASHFIQKYPNLSSM